MLPNFFIAGAPRCATTSLWAALNQHPDVFLSPVKEPAFFSEAHNFTTWNKGFTWYESLFEKHQNESRVGDASTLYFHAPDAPAKIRAFNREARVIIMLRDPVERIYSNYLYHQRTGEDVGTFETFMQNDQHLAQDLKRISHYKPHVEGWLADLPREQIFIGLVDDLKKRPKDFYRNLFSFLGIDKAFRVEPEQRNAPLEPKNKRLARLLNAIRRHQKRFPIPARLRPFFVKLHHLNSKPIEKAELSPALRTLLIPEFLEDIEYVEELLSRDLSHWKK